MNATRAAAAFTFAALAGAYVFFRTRPIVVNGAGSAGDASGGAGGSFGGALGGAGQGVAANALGYLEQAGEELGIVIPRGIRNNNPGNLEWSPSIVWNGQVGRDSDGYLMFDTAEHGSRALGIDLRSAINEGYGTLPALIAHYAPPTENDTAAYVADVAARTGLDPNAQLSTDDAALIAGAIASHENGDGPWTDSLGDTYAASDVSGWAEEA